MASWHRYLSILPAQLSNEAHCRMNIIAKLQRKLFLLLITAFFFSLKAVFADHAFDSENERDLITVTEEMTSAALAILETVSEGPGGIEEAVGYNRQELLHLALDDKARTNYVYWPYLRKGLPLEYMSAQQKILTHRLLNTALSAKGYLTTIQVMQLEKILSDNEVIGFPRGPENYTLAIFGTPSMDGKWAWRFEGHHLSLNFAVASGEISVTPTFFGASPAQIRTGTMAGFRSQDYVYSAGNALLHALTEEQKTIAITEGNPPFDIESGTLNKPRENWNNWKSLDTGIAIASLTPQQKTLAQKILDEIITVYRPEISRAYLAQVDVNALSFTWMGSSEAGQAHYWRLDGPDFFFEYDLVQGNGNHVHTVWRSKEGDFGADLLMEHHRQSH
jgi:hypothetical protein